MKRCGWVTTDPLYMRYHDEEWGKPVKEDHKLFEYLILEGAQAGLSWFTILKKREHYQKVYDGFDPAKISQYDEAKVKVLLEDPGIVRNRLKVNASVINAKAFIEIQKEFGSFSEYIWSYVKDEPIINHWESTKEVPASTFLSDQISKDLKKRGFKFVGTTIIYSFMQAVGMVNDHIGTCAYK